MNPHNASRHNRIPEGSYLVRQQYLVSKSKYKDRRAPFNLWQTDLALLVQIIFDF